MRTRNIRYRWVFPLALERIALDHEEYFRRLAERRATDVQRYGTPAGPGLHFDLDEAVALLERTPASLGALLAGLPRRWLYATEGEGTWSPHEVLGHLVHTERTNWIPRARHILAGSGQPFEPLDRTAHLEENRSRSAEELLSTFAEQRRENLAALIAMGLTSADLELTGLHPQLGEVRLGQLLATWTVHDLTHLAQIVRTMAKAYAAAVGPWSAYLSILRDRE